ncbi:MAG: 2-oxoacid:acceptor oxidoreductase subunit alpha [Verrucomicrobia bacterium]|nr:2-oxoacid:acceptor oxidoreductase subunit alpha [Verrucomicrobiota bacterium]MDA1087506.1 2-oxoacid:acceptor oxidoreductase subunit alpha [Verrucomicrobiota bacterium]
MATVVESKKNVAPDSSDRIERASIVIRFAGDSGDGMQTIGEKFSDSSVLAGNDISTFPDFPAEIRAPAGTLPGISGFQIHFGSTDILTPGDAPDALVAMNPAALKVNLPDLIPSGLLIVNTDTFVPANLAKAGYEENPLDDPELGRKYRLIKLDLAQLTMDALKESPLRSVEKARCKNFLALGLTYWIYARPLEATEKWIGSKWGKKPDLADAVIRTVRAGYHIGETTEIELPTYRVERAQIESGVYRKISGNDAIVLGIVAASESSYRDVVFGSYPITPASSILEGLAEHKNYGIKTVQAEDEIAAVGIAIGASFAGQIGITATSGPGFALMAEFVGLAVMTELPLVVINVQRAGPSTGMPTKTEQADLFQAMYGRNGESPVPVLAAASPGDCFDVVIEAIRIALTYCTPVVLLSEAYIANGAEPWKVPNVKRLPKLFLDPLPPGEDHVIYRRDEKTLARKAVVPGRRGYEHQIGGLEKNERGQVSYDPLNHEKMIGLRAEKVERIADSYPPTNVHGSQSGDVLIVGWGGTYGAIAASIRDLQTEGFAVGRVHLRYVNPLPHDLADIFGRFKKILVPELNRGQLAQIFRGKFLIDVVSLPKVQGRPFTVAEISAKVKELL